MTEAGAAAGAGAGVGADAAGQHAPLRLYQFPCSHFCEKTRWALDYKGLAWQPVNLIPGRHMRVVRSLAPKTTVPVLRDGARAVQGSAEIITWLDQTHDGPRLTPTDAQEASLALEWERWLDSEIGVPLRLWWYHHLLADRRATLNFLLEGAPWYVPYLYTLVWPKLRARMRRYLHIDAENAQKAEARLRAAFDRLDATLAGKRFLVGNRFTRADLTAAALLGRLIVPPASKVPDPPAVQAFRQELRARPVHAWVEGLYRDHRGGPP